MVPPTAAAPQGSWLYMRAEVPSHDEQDVKAMRLEFEVDPANPQELYDRLPSATPSLAGGLLRQAKPQEMATGRSSFREQTFRSIDVESFCALPMLPWKQVYTFFKGSF